MERDHARGEAQQPTAEATLVLPTYNAAAFIGDTVARLRCFVEAHPEWRVLFVCDGCTDATPALLARACAGARGFTVRVHEQNRGKGHAVRAGFDAANTPYLVFTDVDLAYDPEDARRLVALLREGADLAVANRASPDSRHWVSPRDFPSLYRRHLSSRLYNRWARAMLPITVGDTQAGLKAVSRAAWARLSPMLRLDDFAFDTELLARASLEGMRVVETPVSFRYVDPTTVAMVRQGWRMLFAVLRLRTTLRRRPSAVSTSEPA
jgi:glycosyltransferase involved in cell wall biosynthesis